MNDNGLHSVARVPLPLWWCVRLHVRGTISYTWVVDHVVFVLFYLALVLCTIVYLSPNGLKILTLTF